MECKQVSNEWCDTSARTRHRFDHHWCGAALVWWWWYMGGWVGGWCGVFGQLTGGRAPCSTCNSAVCLANLFLRRLWRLPENFFVLMPLLGMVCVWGVALTNWVCAKVAQMFRTSS